MLTLAVILAAVLQPAEALQNNLGSQTHLQANPVTPFPKGKLDTCSEPGCPWVASAGGVAAWIHNAYHGYVKKFYKGPIDEPSEELIRDHAARAWTMKYGTSVTGKSLYPWTQDYDGDMFLNYIVPITHFDENPEEWMKTMNEVLADRVKGLDVVGNSPVGLKEVADAVVQHVWTSFGWPAITFKSNQTPKILSPLSDVLVHRHGSCTAMSIFLADALRSVGVPARVVGIGVWNRPEGGNHNWVEAWFNNTWNFIDAAPGQRTWNRGWFKGIAAKSIEGSINGIATPTWDETKATGNYRITWRKGEDYENLKPGNETESEYYKVPGIDLTQDYKEDRPAVPMSGATGKSASLLLAALALPLLLSF